MERGSASIEHAGRRVAFDTGVDVRQRGPRLSLQGWTLLAALAYVTSTAFIPAAWAIESFHIAIYALLATALLSPVRGDTERRRALDPAAIIGAVGTNIPALIMVAAPLWGILQLLAGWTGSRSDTRLAILHWFALAAVFFLARHAARGRSSHNTFLGWFLAFGVALAALCLLQLFTSHGRVLWIFTTGQPDVYATFPSPNNYAQFVELVLPVALWFALRESAHAWGYALAAGVLYASVVGCASRAGLILCSFELLFFVALSFGKRRRHHAPAGFQFPFLSASLLLTPLLLTLAVGWERVWLRLLEPDLFFVRREYLQAALGMIREHPWQGVGLGVFQAAAPAFAVREFPFYANHVHNDWMEFAAEGGLLFAAALLLVFILRVPAILRHSWSVGLIAVAVHASVDYPFPRAAVSGWIFALLGLIDMQHQNEKGRPHE